MPDFSNPFSGNVPNRMLTPEELIRALRLDLAAEEEATFLYMSHVEATDNPLAKKVLLDIANEERVHVGELSHLIHLLTGDEDTYMARGAAEVDAMAAGTPGIAPAPAAAKPAPAGTPAPTPVQPKTIGSLRI